MLQYRILGAVLAVAAFPIFAVAAGDWPQSGVDTLGAACRQQPRSDVPPKYNAAYCACLISSAPDAIPWNDWVSADATVRATGAASLQGKDKATMIAMLMAGQRCFERTVPQR